MKTKQKMYIKQKNILPKIQMLIHGLLQQPSQKQITFHQQQYSIEHRINSNQININFYESQFSDISQNLEFLGIKSIKHISLSIWRRNRIRIVFFKNDKLYYLSEERKKKQSKQKLRERLVNSQKAINVMMNSNDRIDFITEDLQPEQKTGVFLIKTRQNNYYILKANSQRTHLIHLNSPNILTNIIHSFTNILKIPLLTTSTQNKANQSSPHQSNYFIFNTSQFDKQSFKLLVLNQFKIQSRIVNLPLVASNGVQQKVEIMSEQNLTQRIAKLAQPVGKIRLIKSAFYEIKAEQICLCILIQNKQSIINFYLLNFIINVSSRRDITIKQQHKFSFQSDNYKTIEFIKVHPLQKQNQDNNLILIKYKNNQQTIIKKLKLRQLQQIQTIQMAITGASTFSRYGQFDKIVLLTPYKIFNVFMNHDEMMMDMSNEYDQPNNIPDEQLKRSKNTLINETKNQFKFIQPKMFHLFKQKKYQQIIQPLISFQVEILTKINLNKQISEDSPMKYLVEIYSMIKLYQIVIGKYINNGKVIMEQGQESSQVLQYLVSQPLRWNQILEVLTKYTQQKQYLKILQIWQQFFIEYHKQQFYKPTLPIVSEIINDKFGHVINESLIKAIQISQNIQMVYQRNKICLFVKWSSGVVAIQREVYRKLVKIEENVKVLKKISGEMLIFQLIAILYYQKGTQHFNDNDMKTILNRIRNQNNPEQIQRFVQNFIEQYIQRIQNNIPINPRKNLFNILQIFQNQSQIVINKIINKAPNMGFLLEVRDGKRKDVVEQIYKISKSMNKNNNKQKIQMMITEREKLGLQRQGI